MVSESNISLYRLNKKSTVYQQADAALFSTVCFSSGLLLTTLTYTLNPMIWTILHLKLFHAPVEQEDVKQRARKQQQVKHGYHRHKMSYSKQCFYQPAYCFLLLCTV